MIRPPLPSPLCVLLPNLLLLGLFASFFAGCSDPDVTAEDTGYEEDSDTSDVETLPDTDPLPPTFSAREGLTEQNRFFLRYEVSTPALPFQEVFSLVVSLYEDVEQTRPLTGAELSLRAAVVDFGSVMTTVTTTEELGEGQYRIDGLLFHVPLGWNLTFTVAHGGVTDRLRLTTEEIGRYEGELADHALALFPEEELRRILTLSPVPAPAPDPTNAYADDPAAAHLGQVVFFDTRFSRDGNVACASCHLPDHGFSDPQRLSIGTGVTGRRSMPALHAANQRWLFWDGRTDSLWAQALQPLESPVEHGTNRTRIVRQIFEDPELNAAYEAIFGALPPLDDGDRFPEDARPIDDAPDDPHHVAWQEMSEADRDAVNRVFANLGKAIAAYERRLLRRDAPFDRFVEGLKTGDADNLAALSPEARQGLSLFVGKGNCTFCHSGPEMSNFEFHNLGMQRRSWMPDDDDFGRSAGLTSLLANPFNAAGPYSDAPDGDKAHLLTILRTDHFDSEGAFKTPGLRNVAERAPYMHGGHFQTLDEVMDFYSDMQEDPVVGGRDPLLQPTNLNPEEISALVAFMHALSGAPLPSELLSAP